MGLLKKGAAGFDMIGGDEIDFPDGTSFVLTETWTQGAHSHQTIAADLTLTAAAGGTGHFAASGMFHTHSTVAITSSPYIGGVIGGYDIQGANATTYPSGAVLGQISDGATTAKGIFIAYIDGDSATTTADAAFKVMSNNSTAASGVNFGLDLQDAAHDGFQPVDKAFYKKAHIRMTEDVVMLTGAGAPTDGTTGLNVAGKASLYFDSTNGAVYINTAAKTSPTWKAVTHA